MNSKIRFILLRGLSREKAHWGIFLNKLGMQYPNAEIITPDLPGNGNRYKENSPLSISEMTEQLRASITTKVLEETHIIALSMGGMIALDWATRYPQECTSAILMNTSLKGVSHVYQRLRPTAMLGVIRSIIEANIEKREHQILEITSTQHKHDVKLLEEWRQIAIQHPITRRNAIRQLIAAAQFRAPKRPPTCPVLLLSGANDALVNPNCSHALAELWKLRHHQHPKAGHDLPLDAPDWLVEQVSEWLSLIKRN